MDGGICRIAGGTGKKFAEEGSVFSGGGYISFKRIQIAREDPASGLRVSRQGGTDELPGGVFVSTGRGDCEASLQIQHITAAFNDGKADENRACKIAAGS